MIAAALERAGRPVVHNRAGSNMAWGVATALLDAGRERGQLGLFEVDEAWLAAVARDVQPRLLLLSNLFRDQLDRYGELELLADRWAELTAELDGRCAVRAERGRPARRRPRPRARRRHLLRRRGRLAGAPRHAARRRLEALPQLRPRLRVRGGLPGPHGPLPVPELRADAAGAGGGGHARDARGDGGSRIELRTPQGELSLRLAAARALQRLQRRGGGGHGARAGRAARHGRARRSRASAARSGAWRRSRGRRRAVDPARSRTRPAPTRCCGRSRSRTAARPVDGAERPDRRRPRRVLDLGRRLRGARRARPARDLQRDARGGDGAAAEVRGHRRGARGGPRPGRLTRLRASRTRRASASTPCPPTRRCSSCATYWPTAGWRSGGRNDGQVRDLARRRARLLRRRPCRSGSSWPLPGTGRSSIWAPAPGVWRHTSRRTGTRWWPSTCDPDLLAVLAAARSQRHDRDGPTPAASTLERRFALVIAPMQLAQIVGGHDRPSSHAEASARSSDHGGTFAAALTDPGGGPRGARRPLPAPRHAGTRRLGVLQPAALGSRERLQRGDGAPPPGRLADGRDR